MLTYSSIRSARPIDRGLTERAFMNTPLFFPFGILSLIYVVKRQNVRNIQQSHNLGFRNKTFPLYPRFHVLVTAFLQKEFHNLKLWPIL